ALERLQHERQEAEQAQRGEERAQKEGERGAWLAHVQCEPDGGGERVEQREPEPSVPEWEERHDEGERKPCARGEEGKNAGDEREPDGPASRVEGQRAPRPAREKRS